MATTLNDHIGRVLGGRYRLIAPIGSGASAQVFLADDTTLRRRVAVKVLHQTLATDETFLRRFRAEAQAAAAMNHPHIMAVYDWGQEDVPYLVSEFLGGGSLRDILDGGTRLSVSQTLLVGLEAARGLEYAHRRGFVHRDIKPANLLFDEDARLRIADFGIARALAEAGWTEPQGAVVGTVRYASPEQAKGEPLTGKSDVYALALSMTEAVTGSVPFTTDTVLGTLMARIDQQVPVGAELGALRRVLERAGRPDPSDRPDAGEFIIGLMAAAEELERPAPLPLAGAMSRVPIDGELLDPTMHAGAAHEEEEEEERTKPSDITGIVPTIDATNVIAPVLAPPARVVEREERTPAPRGPAAPFDYTFEDEDEHHRRRWPWVLLGVLLVVGAISGGVIVYLANRTVSHKVPALVGATVDDVRAVAAKNKWVLPDQPDTDRSDDVAKDRIIRTDPPANQKLAEGEQLRYTVSLGNKTVPIPAIVGLPISQAKTTLEQAGLVLANPYKTDFDEKVPKDSVIKLDAVAQELPKGDPVPVVVSKGPKPRVVPPGLEGQPLAAVQQALTQLGLKPVPSEEFNDTVPVGNVIRLGTAPNTEVPRDSEIQVVVSKGPAPRPIPSVLNKSLQDAISTLQAQGFVVSEFRGDASKPVIATDPPAGEVQPYGTKVRIIGRS
ncbi:MAG TPA: protein kinase [Acidimicrobiales bacterium]|nr:protein kinase [Acidimicrobiales bacterium]